MDKSSLIDKYNELWWCIVYTWRACYKVRSTELYQYGITPEEAAVLFTISVIGSEATPTSISRWLLREPHSVSSMVIRMKKKGLVRTVRDFDKKNLKRVVLTKKGKEAYLKAGKRDIIHKIMSDFSEEDCQQLESYLLTLFRKALEEIGREIPPRFPPFTKSEAD